MEDLFRGLGIKGPAGFCPAGPSLLHQRELSLETRRETAGISHFGHAKTACRVTTCSANMEFHNPQFLHHALLSGCKSSRKQKSRLLKLRRRDFIPCYHFSSSALHSADLFKYSPTNREYSIAITGNSRRSLSVSTSRRHSGTIFGYHFSVLFQPERTLCRISLITYFLLHRVFDIDLLVRL